jgi:cell division protein FtsN
MPTAANTAKGGASRSGPKSAAKTASKTSANTAKTKGAKPVAKTPAKTPAKTARPLAAMSAAASVSSARRSRISKIDPDQRHHYVEVAAYYIAERRGFLGGCQAEDWVQAETEIERLLQEGKLTV